MIFKGTEIDTYTELHGGKGRVTIERYLEKGDVERLELFAKVTVEEAGSIGYHQHLAESEGYYITSGRADFIDSDGGCRPVDPGDLCLIEKGGSHGIINRGDGPLEFLAIVF